MNIQNKIVVHLFFLLISSSLVAQTLTSKSAEIKSSVPIDSKVKIGKLPNGFTYYIRKNSTPEKRAVLYLVNKVGSVLETDKQQGLAHFLEHMAFNGTKHFPKNQLTEYLQEAGVRFGADLNAYTSFDETVYQLPIPLDNKSVLKNALQIIHDWAQALTLDSIEIEKERGVILEEKRLRLGSAQRIQDKLIPLRVNNSIYANHQPIGTDEVLKTFRHWEIKQFYKDWYRPDLQALIIVGDIDAKDVEKQIISLFPDLKNPVNEKQRKTYAILLEGKNQFATVTDPEVSATSISLTIKQPAMTMKTDADFRTSLLRKLFGLMMANRFNEIAQKENSSFITASCSIDKYFANVDAFTSGVTLKEGEMKNAVKAWWAEIERLKKFGFTDTELKRASKAYTTSFAVAYKERNNQQSNTYVQEYVRHFLNDEATPGIDYEYKFYTSLIEQITIADFQELIAQLVTDKNRDIVIIANDKLRDSLPTEEIITQWMKEVALTDIPAYLDKKIGRTTLIDKKPVPGQIVKETVNKEMGITELLLSNGMKIVLKPTDFKKDQIVFRAFSPGGLSLVNDADFYSGSIASSMVNAGGIADMPAIDMRRILTGKSVSVSPYISEASEGFAGQSSEEDLETALQLVYLYFTKPRMDQVVFNNFLEQFRLSNQTNGQNPIQVFQDTVAAVFGNHNFRKIKVPIEKINQLDINKAMQVYKDRFADAGDFTFTFVGSFNIEMIKPLLAQYLGALPSLNSKEQVRDLQLNHPPGRISSKVIKGKDPKAAVLLSFGGSFEYNSEIPVQMDALAAIIDYKLINRLREDDGGVYNVKTNVVVRKIPTSEYDFRINFICDPQNVEPLIINTNLELMKLKAEGPTEEDLIKYKAIQKTGLEKVAKENGFWLTYINGRLMNGESIDISELKNNIKNITKESIQALAQQLLTNENYIRIVLVPEK